MLVAHMGVVEERDKHKANGYCASIIQGATALGIQCYVSSRYTDEVKRVSVIG
jgi:hypothetical protein